MSRPGQEQLEPEQHLSAPTVYRPTAAGCSVAPAGLTPAVTSAVATLLHEPARRSAVSWELEQLQMDGMFVVEVEDIQRPDKPRSAAVIDVKKHSERRLSYWTVDRGCTPKTFVHRLCVWPSCGFHVSCKKKVKRGSNRFTSASRSRISLLSIVCEETSPRLITW